LWRWGRGGWRAGSAPPTIGTVRKLGAAGDQRTVVIAPSVSISEVPIGARWGTSPEVITRRSRWPGSITASVAKISMFSGYVCPGWTGSSVAFVNGW